MEKMFGSENFNKETNQSVMDSLLEAKRDIEEELAQETLKGLSSDNRDRIETLEKELAVIDKQINAENGDKAAA